MVGNQNWEKDLRRHTVSYLLTDIDGPFLEVFHSRLSIFVEETLILVWITRWDSTVCAVQSIWGDYKGAFCHSYLWLITALSSSPICNTLPPSWRPFDSSHPKALVSSCTYLFIQKDLAEMRISLKHQSHSLTPSILSWSQTSLPSVQWYLPELLSHTIILPSLFQFSSFSPSQKSDRLHFFIYLFCLKVMGMQSLTAAWISEATSPNSAIAFPLLPKSKIKSIWNILTIIWLLTNAILIYSEAHSK